MSRLSYISSNDVLLLLPFLWSRFRCGDCVVLQNVADEVQIYDAGSDGQYLSLDDFFGYG